MPDEKNKILKYANGTKSLKMEHAIYLDLECLLVKHNTFANNPNSSYSKTIPTHETSGYSTVVVSRHISSYQMHYREEDCMNKLSSNLLTIGERIANEEKKDEKPLTNYQESKYEESEYCNIFDRTFNTDEQSKY